LLMRRPRNIRGGVLPLWRTRTTQVVEAISSTCRDATPVGRIPFEYTGTALFVTRATRRTDASPYTASEHTDVVA
jgi:hypothetical protein